MDFTVHFLASLLTSAVSTAFVKTTAGLLICRFIQGCLAGCVITRISRCTEPESHLGRHSPTLGVRVMTCLREMTLDLQVGRHFQPKYKPQILLLSAVALYTWASVLGPAFGNFFTGFISQEKGFRWTFYVLTIIFGVWWFLLFFFVPETRDTRILAKRAKQRRQETGNEALRSPHEDDLNLRHLFRVTLLRPFKFLFTEPIVMFAAAYNGLGFAVLLYVAVATGLNISDWDLDLQHVQLRLRFRLC